MPVAFLGALYLQVIVGEPAFVQKLTSEDHLIENLTVAAYLVGAITAGVALWKGNFRLAAAVWLVLCVIFVGEETSWFQRAIGYSVPAVEERNSQAEFNLHNLDFLHGSKERTFLDENGDIRFELKQFLTSQTLFRLGFISYFLLLPLFVLIPPVRRLAERMGLPPFDWTHLAVCWLLIAVTIPMTLMVDGSRRLAVAECRELVYALTIALYAASLLYARSQTTASDAATRRAYLPRASQPIAMWRPSDTARVGE